MLKKIRSTFILKKIFNHIYNKRKFQSIVHNKKLQQKLGLNLIDFRRVSGRYIEEEYDKTIEYNSYNHRKIFEGHYSNGKRNGEEKEYDEDGNLIFKGEFLDGKRWKGHGKEYDEDTENLIFEYELLNGTITGEGKEYDKINRDLLFSGNHLNGKRNGKGEECKYIPYEKRSYDYTSYSLNTNIKQITIFKGEYLDGERKEGKEYNYEGRLLCDGGYRNGKKYGIGKIYYNERNDDILKYEGGFLKGKENGKGKNIIKMVN